MGYSLSKLSERCKGCPKMDKCEHKKMELCALAELPPQIGINAGQGILENSAMPLLREKIKSPLSPFAYKDELEKEIYKSISVNHEMFGA